MTPKRPHDETELPKFLDRRLLQLKPVKSQIEISNEARFNKLLQRLTFSTAVVQFETFPIFVQKVDKLGVGRNLQG